MGSSIVSTVMMSWTCCYISLLFILTGTVASSDVSEEHHVKPTRVGRIFLVSTTSSTSVLTTSTICWVSTNAAISAQCTRRKRRRDIMDDAEMEVEGKQLIAPSRMDREGSDDRQAELESGLGKGEREGRGFLYWATTTDISTSTTFSATSTLASLACTPSAFTINQCG